MNERKQSTVATGMIFILLGLGLFGMRYLDATGETLTLLLLGGVGVAGYLYSGTRLLLIVGGVCLGLGIGSFGERRFSVVGEFTEIGLGVGFLLVWLIGLIRERRSSWWPLVAGSVLLLLGFRAWNRFRVFLFSERGWPLILVIVGVLILLGGIGRGRRRRRSA